MLKKHGRSVITLASIGLIVALLLAEFLSQPGTRDLAGYFEEVAFVRNEQNKGGIVRVYAFTVRDTAIADYRACGDLLPHNDYGSTTVAYFFQKGQPAPESLKLDSPHFDTARFRPLARYTKGQDAKVTVETVR